MQNLPKSASSAGLSLVALLLFLVIFFLSWPESSPMQLQSLLAIGLIAVPILLGDALFFKTWKNPSTGLDWQNKRSIHWERVLLKWFALIITFAAMSGIYWLLPEYDNIFYQPFFELARPLVPSIILIALPYFAVMDKYMKEPEDSYSHLGRWVCRRQTPNDLTFFKQHCLSWLVKGFFLPIMYCYLPEQLTHAQTTLTYAGVSILGTFFFIHTVIFLVDLLFATVGYLCTFRLTDTHIRTAEPTFFGWAVAVVCYKPFWDFFYQHFIQYHHTSWEHWLNASAGGGLVALWAVMILTCDAIYAWATICFGVRFSNVSYRGTITSGPYRWTRHPAYVFKNLSWWLLAVPFAPILSWEVSLQACLALLLNNLIYYWRAKTEERHLLQYDDYRAYYEWMEEHGILTKRLTYFHRKNIWAKE
jgi:protein-S-isoprenylcysteine O-methyltransferase Ste14